MIEQTRGSDWVFVIDTDRYAGNFERELCAWITSVYGECQVGEELAQIAEQELSPNIRKYIVDELVEQVPDEHGCQRPVTIWSNPKWFNDGAGNHWRIDDDRYDFHVNTYKHSIINLQRGYMKPYQEILVKLERGEKVDGWTKEMCEKEIGRFQSAIHKVKKIKKFFQHDAYMSVGIWLSKRPTDEIISLFKERSKTFVEAYKKYSPLGQLDEEFFLTIEGFRLIHIKKTLDEEII